MSLLFDTGTKLVTIPDAASIQDLTAESSFAAWVKLSAETSGFPRLFDKGEVFRLHRDRDAGAGAGSLEMLRSRATTFTRVIAALPNLFNYIEGAWMFVGASLHGTTDARNILVVGTQSHLAVEPSSYAVQTAGSGTFTSDVGADLILGNRALQDRMLDGAMAWAALWKTALGVKDFQFHQEETYRLLTTRRWDLRTRTGAIVDMPLGVNVPLRTIDSSGYGNHGIVTSATLYTPLPPVRRRQRQRRLLRSFVDETIWQLGELSSPALVDLLVAVDDPAGTPATRKLALSDFAPLTVSNVVVQVKTVGSGTYTPTAGMKKVLAIAVGSGGGGGGGINTDSAGGGGGGGGTVIRLMTAAQIGASKAYVVGAGGAAAGNGNATTLDTAGALMNAGGGSAGGAGATSTTVGTTTAGGAGGSASNGDLNIPGEPGERGIIYDGTNGCGGRGGGSRFGAGGAESGSNTAGNTGAAYGGGGGGGHASGTADRAGGAGADGILYLIEFIG